VGGRRSVAGELK